MWDPNGSLSKNLAISSDASYDDNSENLNELNKPVVNKRKDLVAVKTRGGIPRNRHDFGVSPVSLASTNASVTSRKEYETITSILAAAAHMDTSSRGSYSGSPELSDYSYASLKERISSSRKNPVKAEQSPPSFQSSPYDSSNASQDVFSSTTSSSSSSKVLQRHVTTSISASKMYAPSYSPAFDSQRRLQGALKAVTSVQNEPSPSAQTTESIITSWSVDAISPKNSSSQPCDQEANVKEYHQQPVKNGNRINLLLDDESSKDFELDLNSQGTNDYDEIMIQDMRYPRIVDVHEKLVTTSTSQTSTIPKPVVRRAHEELRPPSPRPTSRISWYDHALHHQLIQSTSPLLSSQEVSPPSISIQPPQNNSTCLKQPIDENLDIDLSLLTAVSLPTITVSQLQSIVSSQGRNAACQKDAYGRFPLHILSTNYNLLLPLLLSTPQSHWRQRISHEASLKLNINRMISMTRKADCSEIVQLEEFIFDLIRLNPKALISPDSNGMIPFTASIYEWIHICNQSLDRDCLISTDSSQASEGLLDDSGLSTSEVHADSRSDVEYGFDETRVHENREKPCNAIQLGDASTRSKPPIMNTLSINFFNHWLYYTMVTPINSDKKDILKAKTHEKCEREKNPSDTVCRLGNNSGERSIGYAKFDEDRTINVEWCLQILGRILSLIPELDFEFNDESDVHNLLVPYPSHLDGFQAKFISIISSIPSLMKILILKTDIFVKHSDLNRIPIFNALITSDDSVGNWIVFMLEAFDHNVVSRCVSYLECLSTIPSFIQSIPQRNDVSDGEKFTRFFHKISHLNFILPATLSIENMDDVNRAVSTMVIQYCMDQELRMQPSMIIVLLDFLFRTLLIISFQLLSCKYITHDTNQASYMAVFYLILTSIFYGLLRLLSRMISTVKVSLRTYSNFVGGFYDWVERVSISMALIATFWIDINKNEMASDSLKYFICITTLCLWIRMLTWFYVVNFSACLFFRAVGKVCII